MAQAPAAPPPGSPFVQVPPGAQPAPYGTPPATNPYAQAPPYTQPQQPYVQPNPYAQPAAPPASLGTNLGSFDPYSTGAASTPPALLAPPNQQAPILGNAPGSPQPLGQAPSPYLYGQQFPPQQPPAVFPNGVQFNQPVWQQPAWGAAGQGMVRFMQDLGFETTWVAGGDGADVDMFDVEVATTINLIPNFLHTGEPLSISPKFIFHFWDGPETDPGVFDADLPSKAYSAFADLGWRPRFTPQLSAELALRLGVFTDFQAFNTDSFRIEGLGLAKIQVTPTVAVKLGAAYLDRLKVKFLPAGGILWTPNPKTQFDIVFPNPKLASFLTVVGNTEYWWYIAGEYGGGNWTVERIDGSDDRVDINDIRAIVGVEWTTLNRMQGFFEAGFVFEREVLYYSGVQNFEPGETFMLRAGLSY